MPLGARADVNFLEALSLPVHGSPQALFSAGMNMSHFIHFTQPDLQFSRSMPGIYQCAQEVLNPLIIVVFVLL